MSEKTKILIFMDWYVPGYKAGGPIRSVYNLSQILKEVFSLRIITSNRDLGDSEGYPNIVPNRWESVGGIPVYYAEAAGLSYAKLRRLLRNTDFDIAYINNMFSYRFSLLPLLICHQSGKKIVLAPRGMLGRASLQEKAFKKRLFLRAARLSGFYKNITWHATNPEEAKDIRRIFGKHISVQIASNIPAPGGILKKRKKTVGELKLCFVGRISPIKNILFAIEILQSYRYPDNIIFEFYGPAEEPQYLEKCLSAASETPKNISVYYKGVVNPERLPDLFAEYHFLFFPSRNENFGHSIYESLAAGTPIIISKSTPWQNLEEKNCGKAIDLSDKEQFRTALREYAKMSQETYDTMSAAAYRFARDFLSRGNLLPDTRKLFE